MQRFTRRESDDMIRTRPFMKNEDRVWNSYEKWVESHRCKCGKHGSNDRQPLTVKKQ